jgi:hypothetical protein
LIDVVLAVQFILFNSLAGRFTRIIVGIQADMSPKQTADNRIAAFTALAVGIIFALCFFVKSAIFIAFCVVQTLDFPIIVFTLLEVVPTFALMLYVAPARTPLTDAYSSYSSSGKSTTTEVLTDTGSRI